MVMLKPIFIVNIIALVAALVVAKYATRRRRERVPPGPPGWPVIGNILDMPSSHEWRTFARWSEEWGKPISLPSVLLPAHAAFCQVTLSQCICWASV